MLTSCFFGAMRSVNPYELSLLTQNISFPPTRVFALLDYFSFLQTQEKNDIFSILLDSILLRVEQSIINHSRFPYHLMKFFTLTLKQIKEFLLHFWVDIKSN